MSASPNDVVDQMRATLAVADPDLDTSVGTTTRKILDAVAESIAESYLDQHMLAYTYDVDAKTDGDLDTFCQTVGGIARLSAKRATGLVTFSRSGPVDSTLLIPVNTHVTSKSNPLVSVQTVVSATMLPGETMATVPAQAVNGGPDGNVGANDLTLLADPVAGVGTVTNSQPLSGGVAQETDDELRTRWKKTALRSNAGTESMYLATALDDPSVTAAQVVGSSKRKREQVQVTNGVAQSTTVGIAYTFPTGVFVGANIDAGVLLLKDIDYSWDTTTNPPRVVITSGVTTYDTGQVDSGGNPIRANLEGAVLDLDFEYVPQGSRNDPDGTRFGNGNVMNRVDIWVAGQRPTTAKQSMVFRSDKRFTGDTTSPYSTTKFARLDGSAPVSNNAFLPMAFGPIIAVPDSLSVGGVTYGRIGGPTSGITHPNVYAIVQDITTQGRTATSQFGLEWDANYLPANNTVFTVGNNNDYLFDDVPRSVQSQVDRWRLAGVDAKVHAANQTLLRFSLALVYSAGADHSAVNADIDAAISLYLSKAGLGGVVQVSDIVQVVHNVSGVDNVRMMRTADYPSWTSPTSNSFNLGIQRVVNGVVVQTYVSSSGQPQDIFFTDDSMPVFESSVKVVKAANTFKY